MKILFLLAVVCSVGYLIYQEYPQSPGLGADIVKSQLIEPRSDSSYQMQIDALERDLDIARNENKALRQLLSDNVGSRSADTYEKTDGDVDLNNAGDPAFSANSKFIANSKVNSKVDRSEALLELAERMELHAFKLANE